MRKNAVLLSALGIAAGAAVVAGCVSPSGYGMMMLAYMAGSIVMLTAAGNYWRP